VLIEDDRAVGKVYATGEGLYTCSIRCPWSLQIEYATPEAAMRACERGLDENKAYELEMIEAAQRKALEERAKPYWAKASAAVGRAINASRPVWNGFAKESN